MTSMMNTARAALAALTGHRHYKYRGCAPDPDQPARAAGNPGLSVDAWSAPDTDGGEDQGVRRRREAAAKAVCAGCPVQTACLAYGLSTTGDGRLAEPYGIVGGATALERHREFIRTRQAAVDDKRLRTPQKLAVLRALAAHADPYEVAAAAGVDVRTANWQRSAVCTLLGLDKQTATRGELLAAASERGLLDAVTVVDPQAVVLAVPPPGSTPQGPAPAPASDVVLPLPTPGADRRPRRTRPPAAPSRDDNTLPRAVRRIPTRRRFQAGTGQLAFPYPQLGAAA